MELSFNYPHVTDLTFTNYELKTRSKVKHDKLFQIALLKNKELVIINVPIFVEGNSNPKSDYKATEAAPNNLL